VNTDNRNRTASDIRHLFSKYGGNLGETGCVSWMFNRIGSIIVPKASVKIDGEDFLLFALDCGADDVKEEENFFEVTTPMDQLMQVVAALEQQVEVEGADLIMQPQNIMEINDEGLAGKVFKLVDMLEDHDDVKNLYANFSVSDEIANKI
jgi:transcriptional/translational regulatory protein YebC/TACO1